MSSTMTWDSDDGTAFRWRSLTFARGIGKEDIGRGQRTNDFAPSAHQFYGILVKNTKVNVGPATKSLTRQIDDSSKQVKLN